jgi:hypothetical protein
MVGVADDQHALSAALVDRGNWPSSITRSSPAGIGGQATGKDETWRIAVNFVQAWSVKRDA